MVLASRRAVVIVDQCALFNDPQSAVRNRQLLFEGFEITEHVVGGLITLLAVFAERPSDNSIHLCARERWFPREPGEWLRLLVDDRRDDIGRGLAREQRLSRYHFVKHGAK